MLKAPTTLKKICVLLLLAFTFLIKNAFAAEGTTDAQNAKSMNAKSMNAKSTNTKTAQVKVKTLEQELQENKNLITQLKKKMDTQTLKESELMTTLQSMESELNALIQSLTEMEKQIKKGEEELKKLQDSMNRLNSVFQEKLQHFAKQMKATYIFKKNSPLKLFLSEQNPNNIDRLVYYYHVLEKHHYHTLSQLLNDMHDISAHQTERNTMQDKIKTLKEMKLSLINNLKTQQEAHQKKFTALKKDILQTEAALKLSEANEKVLMGQLDKIQTAFKENAYKGNTLPFFKSIPFSKTEGQCLWPIRSEPHTSLVSPYMIKAKEREPVHATYEGRVVFADRLNGFGLLLIIDHGEGYMSLYGQNQALFKKLGDTVKRGDLIAHVGRENEEKGSASENSGLYFEVRKNGKPINLVNWFN